MCSPPERELRAVTGVFARGITPGPRNSVRVRINPKVIPRRTDNRARLRRPR